MTFLHHCHKNESLPPFSQKISKRANPIQRIFRKNIIFEEWGPSQINYILDMKKTMCQALNADENEQVTPILPLSSLLLATGVQSLLHSIVPRARSDYPQNFGSFWPGPARNTCPTPHSFFVSNSTCKTGCTE